MNTVNPGGLLWFDDDNRRSIQEKIAEAAQRYRERVGYEPTVCQLNPAQAAALQSGADRAAARQKRAQAGVKPSPLPATLRLVPSELIQPHCYLICIGEGEEPKPAALPYRDDPEPVGTKAGAAKASQSYRVSRVAKAKPVEKPIVPVAEKPAPLPGKRATIKKATANKMPAREVAAKQPVAALPATRAKVARRRVRAVEQPTLIALAPEFLDVGHPATAAKRASRKSGETTALAKRAKPAKPSKTVAAEPTVPTLILPAAATAKPSSSRRRTGATKGAAVESPTLPLVEATTPHGRRTRAPREASPSAASFSAASIAEVARPASRLRKRSA